MTPESSRAYLLGADMRYDELFQAESRYAFISVRTIDGNPNLRAMMLDRLMHSEVNVADPLDVMYGHNRVYAALAGQTFGEGEQRKIYVLGGGGYGFPKYLEAAYPRFDVDVAEFDPLVVEIAKTHFGLATTGRIHSVVQDARTYIDDLLRTSGESNGVYDAIFSDIVSDYEIPFHLLTEEYLAKVHRALKADGYYAFIVIDSQSLGALVSSVYMTARTVFPEVNVIACSDNPSMRDMFVVVCSKRPMDVDKIIPNVKGQPTFRGARLPATALDAIAKRNRSFVLTDDHAPVEYMASKLSLIDSDEPVEQLTRAGLEAVHRGDLDTALDCLQKAAQRNPKSVPTAFNLAHVLADVGRLDEAAVIVDRAVAVEPDNANMQDFAAMLAVRRGDIQAAILMWRDLLSRHPGFMPARNNLATALLLSKQPASAIEVLSPAVEMNPSNALAWFNLGNANMSLGKLDDATRNFEKALGADSTMGEAAYSLGVIELRNGRADKARQYFLDALRRNPQLEAAAQQLRRISGGDALQ